MADRAMALAGFALIAATLMPAAAKADVRIEERLTSLDSAVTRWTLIKGDKRSVVTRAETSGVLYNAGAKFGAYVEIARPDRELIWDVDPQERSYRELTREQFTRLLQKGIQAPRTANDQPLRTLYRSETTAIEVAPTGKTKRIAGYVAEEVVARVVIGATNLLSGNKLSFAFDQQIWLTKDETLLANINAFEDAYVDAFGSAVSLQQAQLLASSWSDAFIPHLRAMNDRVRALKGFVLASTTTVTEQAVAQSKDEKSTSRRLSVASSEVRKVSLDTLPASEFELPAGYINADTKVAVAGPLAETVEAPAPPPAAPKPVVVAVAPPVKPATPAKPTREPVGPSVAAAGPNASVPASTSAASAKPSAPVAAAVPTTVTGPPSNVIVRGGPTANGAPRTMIDSYVAPPIQGSIAVLALNSGMSMTAGPSIITIDEPEEFLSRKSKKKKRR